MSNQTSVLTLSRLGEIAVPKVPSAPWSLLEQCNAKLMSDRIDLSRFSLDPVIARPDTLELIELHADMASEEDIAQDLKHLGLRSATFAESLLGLSHDPQLLNQCPPLLCVDMESMAPQGGRLSIPYITLDGGRLCVDLMQQDDPAVWGHFLFLAAF